MDNNALRQAAIKELARRELERRKGAMAPMPGHGSEMNPNDPLTQFVNQTGAGRAFVDGTQSGVTFGADDELAGAGRALKNTGGLLGLARRAIDPSQEAFSPIMKEEYRRGRRVAEVAKQFRENKHPYASVAGEVAGGLTTAGGLAKSGVTLVGRTTGKGIPTRMLAGATEGAAYGGLYGAGNANPGERLKGAQDGALVGAVTGGALEGVAGRLAKRSARKALNKSVPTSVKYKKRAKPLYRKAKKAGAMVQPKAYEKMMRSVANDLDEFGYDQDLQRRVPPLLRKVGSNYNKATSVPELEKVRRMANNVLKDGDGSEREIAKLVKRRIDELMDNKSAWMGDKSGLKALKKARTNWSQAKKMEIVEKAVRDGSAAASGSENGVRNAFRAILKSDKKRRLFTADEIKAMEQIRDGSRGQNILKLLGKLGYGSGGSNSFVGGTLGVLTGGSIGGPVGAALMPAIGYGAQKAAIRAQQGSVDGLLRTVGNKGKAPLLQLPRYHTQPLIGVGAQEAEAFRRGRSN